MTPAQMQDLIALLRALEEDSNSVKVTDACRLVRRAALARLSRAGRDGHVASPRVLADPRQLTLLDTGIIHHQGGGETHEADEERREREALLNVKQA